LKQFADKTFSGFRVQQTNDDNILFLVSKKNTALFVSLFLIWMSFPLLGLLNGITLLKILLIFCFLLSGLILLYVETDAINFTMIDLKRNTIKISNISIMKYFHLDKEISFDMILEIYSQSSFVYIDKVIIKTKTLEETVLIKFSSKPMHAIDSSKFVSILERLLKEYKK
jgi:hypothetical protein